MPPAGGLPPVADPLDVHEFFHLLEATRLISILDDELGRPRTDARERLERRLICRVEVNPLGSARLLTGGRSVLWSRVQR